MKRSALIANKIMKIVATMLVIAALVGCTNVQQWGVTVREDGTELEAKYSDDTGGYVKVFGDLSLAEEVNAADIDFSAWDYDKETLRVDGYNIDSFGSKTEITFEEPITVAGLDYVMTIDKVDFFEDEEAGGYGIAVVYTIENKSKYDIYFSGVLENVVKFAMFAPDGTSLKNHYDLSNPPIESDDYEGRIEYPVQIYSPSMSTTEVAPDKKITMYRVYDFAGTGEYSLYIGTNIRAKIESNSVLLKIIIEEE